MTTASNFPVWKHYRPDQDRARVLIVDDEPHLVGMYSAMLDDDYAVRTATSGQEALEKVEEGDIVLLDRDMPGLSGDQVLQDIRASGYTCPVAMVTVLEPRRDIVDLGFDAYVVKPVRENHLRQTVDSLRKRQQYRNAVREKMRTISTIQALESTHSEEELKQIEEYVSLEQRLERLDNETRSVLEDLLDGGRADILYLDLLSQFKSANQTGSDSGSGNTDEVSDRAGGFH